MPIFTGDPSAPPSPSSGIGGLDAATDSENSFLSVYGASSNPAALGGMPTGGMPTAGTGAGTPTGEPDDPMLIPIFVGYRTVTHDAPSHMTTGDPEFDNYGSGTVTRKKPRYRTVGELLRNFESQTIAERHDWYRRLLIAGFLADGRSAVPTPDNLDEMVRFATADEVSSAYLGLLSAVYDFQQRNQIFVTPEQYLRDQMGFRLQGWGVNWDGDLNAFNKGFSHYLKDSGQGESAFGGGGGSQLAPKPKPFTDVRVDKSVNFMDPEDAKGLARAMLQNELGRDPTQAEYEEFVSAINAAEKANPTVTKTTTRYGYDKDNPNAGRDTGFGNFGVLSQSSVTHGGLTEPGLNQLMYEKAISNPDWAEWQAMGTYFPALLAALGPTVPGA